MAKGLAKGLAKGRINGLTEVAKNMLAKGMSTDVIAEMTGLSETEIDALNTENASDTQA